MKYSSTLEETKPNRKRTSQEDTMRRGELEQLLHEARTAPDRETALEIVQRAVTLVPDDPRVHESLQLRVFETLRSDAYVAFLAETEKHYVITFRNSRPFSVPKARGRPEIFPRAQRTDGERALSMVWWMLLGLIPAGLGTLILVPVAVQRAVPRPTTHGPE